jgi:hypothetical protein
VGALIANAPRGTKKTSARLIAEPISLRWDVRMVSKHHSTPLSGGERKALTKQLCKARAVATILASQPVEMRAKGEALIQRRPTGCRLSFVQIVCVFDKTQVALGKTLEKIDLALPGAVPC